MGKTLNYIIVILLFLLCIIGVLAVVFSKNKDIEEEIEDDDFFSYEKIKQGVKNKLDEMCHLNILEMNLSYVEAQKLKKTKSRLKAALRTCHSGDRGQKEYVKDYIKQILVKDFNISDDNIERVLSFSDPTSLPDDVIFDMLLWDYEKKYGDDAVDKLFTAFKWDIPREGTHGTYYEITIDDVKSALTKSNVQMDYLDKLECLTQRIYSETKGNSVIDRIRDLKIDCVSGGLGGIPEGIYNYKDEIIMTGMNVAPRKDKSYDYVSAMFHGKTIHISALSFGSQRQLERVCKNIYRYDASGHLSINQGYIMNDVADGSRVVVARPYYADSWGFLVRKLDNVTDLPIEQLIPQAGNSITIEILRQIVRGFNVLVISGDPGSGKTTLLRKMIGFLKQSTNIRSQELLFELQLKKMYKDWNIWSFRETQNISTQQSVDMTKKTDCEAEILGEVADQKVACIPIQLSQTGCKMTMCTAHPNDTDSLVEYFADSLVSTGNCPDQYTAERKVSKAIRFDIHMTLQDGQRFLQRITEIIPYEYQDAGDDIEKLLINYLKVNSRQKPYYIRNILEMENGQFVIKNRFSKRTEERMMRYMDPDDRKRYKDFWDDWEAKNKQLEVS